MTLSVKKEVRSTALLAGPIIASSLAQVANGFIDTIMLGRYHPEHLAAGALGASLWVFVSLTGMGLSMGIAPMAAQLMGAGRRDQIKNVFQQGIWLCLAIALLLIVVLNSLEVLMVFIGVEPVIIPLVHSYVSIVAWGVAASQVYMAGRFISEAVEYTRPMMIIQIVLLPLNALLNYLLIFGHWGMPELGVVGAGIATTICMLLGLILMMVNLIFNSKYSIYQLFTGLRVPEFKTIYQILVISVPIAISMTFETSLFTGISLLMGKLGTIPLAGHQIAINYASLMFMIPLGFSSAATVRAGNAIGRGDYLDARHRGWVAIGMSAVFMSVSAIVIFLFNRQIAAIYTTDQQVMTLASSLLILAGIFQFSDGTQISAAGVLRGYKDTKVPMLIGLLGYWVIGFPVAYLLCFRFGFAEQGLWMGLIIGLTVTAVLLLLRFNWLSSSQQVPQTA